jgi:hypothetical protein
VEGEAPTEVAAKATVEGEAPTEVAAKATVEGEAPAEVAAKATVEGEAPAEGRAAKATVEASTEATSAKMRNVRSSKTASTAKGRRTQRRSRQGDHRGDHANRNFANHYAHSISEHPSLWESNRTVPIELPAAQSPGAQLEKPSSRFINWRYDLALPNPFKRKGFTKPEDQLGKQKPDGPSASPLAVPGYVAHIGAAARSAGQERDRSEWATENRAVEANTAA